MQTVRVRKLRKNSLILPYFCLAGKRKREPIRSMPGVNRLSVDNLLKDIPSARKAGVQAILLFGIPEFKDRSGSQAYQSNGVVQQAVAALKKEFKGLAVITDVCLCGYTKDAHCGIVKQKRKFKIDNQQTLNILAKIALSHAAAGADFVAPSAMMPGQVKAIRKTLDKNGFTNTGILAYSAKYASDFYGPFREALDSRPRFGDRRAYQLDYRNSQRGLKEIQQDIDEGADIVMVKPALAYLDIIFRAKQQFNVPIAAYNVSGEYALVKSYSRNSVIQRKLAAEMLSAIRRAGADFIISYWAKEASRWLSY